VCGKDNKSGLLTVKINYSLDQGFGRDFSIAK